MRIGMVSATYDPTVQNGVLRMVSLYKEHLEARGHEVLVFALGEHEASDYARGIIRSPGLRLGDHGYYVSMRYSREAQRLLSRLDIVHCHHLFMSVELAHRYADCPIVYTNHTRYDLYTGAYTPLPQAAADAIMRQVWPNFTDLADVVIAPSESMRQVMLDFGVRRPIVVIPNGVELDRLHRPAAPRVKADFGLAETDTLLLYIGRLAEEKNLQTLLHQFRTASFFAPHLRLALIGRGPQEDELRALANDLGLGQQVIFVGSVAYEQVPDYLSAADIFVTASTSEVHPLTVIEAMAAGKPVAAVSSPGIAETVEDGLTGCLAATSDKLAGAIARLTANPDRTREMGAAAAAASLRYDINHTIDQTLALYEQMLTDRPDLDRTEEHGRWFQRTESWAPLLDQLAELVRPSLRPGDVPRIWQRQ